MSKQYFYARDGHRMGPVTKQRLKELADGGHLLPTDMIWTEGLPGWAPAAKFTGLWRVQSAEAQSRRLPRELPSTKKGEVELERVDALRRPDDTMPQVRPAPQRQRNRARTNRAVLWLLCSGGVVTAACAIVMAVMLSTSQLGRPQPLDCSGPNGLSAAEVKAAQQAWARYLGRQVEEEDEIAPGVMMRFALVPPGKFLMGSTREEQDSVPEKYFIVDDEMRHTVTLTKMFYLAKYEVTVGQFRKFVDSTNYQTEAESSGEGSFEFDGTEWKRNKDRNWRNPGFEQTDDHPVTCVSHNDALRFINWLNDRSEHSYCLPTEAQWEYSCRGGATSRYHFGEDEELLAEYGNVADASAKKQFPGRTTIKSDDRYVFTAPVGQFRANGFGLHDMHGNVCEWCSDWFARYPFGSGTDPTGPDTGSGRVVRGGGWDGGAISCRAAYRDRRVPATGNVDLGFRVARVPCTDEKSKHLQTLSEQEKKTNSLPATDAQTSGHAVKRGSPAGPRSLEDLHLRRDGPPDFTATEWSTLKTKLYHDGFLGHVVQDGIFEYRLDPVRYLSVFRAMRDVFEDNGFKNPSANQIYNGANLFLAGQLHQLDPNRAADLIRTTGKLAKQAGTPLISRTGFRELDQ
jgi:formylglycine-generating enzyme required for sulfatase activity